MYNIFEYLKAMYIVKYVYNNKQDTRIHSSQYIHHKSPVTAKNEPYEIDMPVPQKCVYY